MTKLTVITTIFRGEQFIVDAARNLKLQTLTDFEWIIIVDEDCETGHYNQLLNEYSDLHFEIHYVGRIGRGNALNLAVSMSQTNLVAIYDVDDLWHPKKLELQYNYMTLNHNLILLGTKHTTSLKLLSLKDTSVSILSISEILCYKSISHSSIMVRKSHLRYNEDLKSQLDLDLVLNILSNSGNQSIVNSTLTYNRIHNSQFFQAKQVFRYRIHSTKIRYKYARIHGNYIYILFIFVKLFFIIPLLLLRNFRFKLNQFSLAQSEK